MISIDAHLFNQSTVLVAQGCDRTTWSVSMLDAAGIWRMIDFPASAAAAHHLAFSLRSLADGAELQLGAAGELTIGGVTLARLRAPDTYANPQPNRSTLTMQNKTTRRAALEAERTRRAARWESAVGEIPADAPDENAMNGVLAQGKAYLLDGAHGASDHDADAPRDLDNGSSDDDGELRERFEQF